MKSLLHQSASTSKNIILIVALAVFLITGATFIFLLPQLEDAVLRYRKETLKELTASAVSQLMILEEQVQAGTITKTEAYDSGAEIIRKLRYGDTRKQYFWAIDANGVMIAHPFRSDMERQALADYKDQTGIEPFNDMLRVANTPNSTGFVQYHWQKHDNASDIQPKLSHVRKFEPWGWVVGTGLYLDDLSRDTGEVTRKALIIFSILLVLVILSTAAIVRQARLADQKTQKARKQREKLIQALKEGEERYRTIADFAYDWEIWLTPANEVIYCSPSCQRITGYAPEEFFERPELVEEIIRPDDRKAWNDFLSATGTSENEFDFCIDNKRGEQRWLAAAGRQVFGIGMKPLGLRLSIRDITDRKKMENQLRYQALHDPLTGLANRSLCLDRIHGAIERAKRRTDYHFAVIFLDLDRFKLINDSLGHRFGDIVLMEAAARLTRNVRGLDTVARFGGDEFVLLLDDLSSHSQAIRIVKRIREDLAAPYTSDGSVVHTTGSFGVVFGPDKNNKPEEMLQNANIAMHRAKDTGRNRMKVFTQRMLTNAVDRLSLENDMHGSLDSGDMYLVYQPIIYLETSSLIGFEALCRWKHPRRGEIPPSEFIPMAEETGLIDKVGIWVLEQALQTLANWRKTGGLAEDVFVAVNLSGKQFSRADLFERIKSALDRSEIPPHCLKLEITETAVMENPDAALNTLDKLRKLGVQFAIDDFGTGYSSLTQLQRLPVDTLKIDRSFISRMVKDAGSLEIVKAIIAMANSLGLDVVAEGVETMDQLEALTKLKCECVQGFYFFRPLPLAAAEALLAEKNDGTPLPERYKCCTLPQKD